MIMKKKTMMMMICDKENKYQNERNLVYFIIHVNFEHAKTKRILFNKYGTVLKLSFI